MPRLRQRLAAPLPGLGEPYWVDDERFAIERHVEAAGIDAPVNRRRWQTVIDDLLSTPLPRSRPLWHIAYADDLPGGRLGLLCRMHHAMVDGIAALDLGLLLLDTEPTEPPEPPDGWTPSIDGSRARLSAIAVVDALAGSTRRTAALARAGVKPHKALPAVVRAARNLAATSRRDLLWSAPPSRLNSDIGPRRTVVRHRLPLATVKRAGRERNATVTEICISLVAGALRAVLAEPPVALKAMIPVSTVLAGDDATGGNNLSFGFVALPLDQPDPERRLAAICEQCAALKRAARDDSSALLIDLLGALPTPVRTLAAAAAAAPRMANLTISSIQGPSETLYLLGAELASVYPVVPLPERHTLAVGVFGYRTSLHVGLHVDPTALPEVAALPRALTRELRLLVPARFPAGGRPTDRPRVDALQDVRD